MKYKRVLIKISGEALKDDKNELILSHEKLVDMARIINDYHHQGLEVSLVVGAGNIWRGKLSRAINIDQATGDYMGMISTLINALALQSALQKLGLSSRVMSSVEIRAVAEPYIRRKAIHHLEEGRIVIFAGGTGNPYFTTDTTASLRAMEIEAEAILVGKNGVDGAYTCDPNKSKDATLIATTSYREILEKQLEVMDLTAISLLVNSNITMHIFNMNDIENFNRIICGEKIGTVIRKE
ncbi:MAG: UMP kinase [Erysipelotrichaceae bacterium]|jgi:uridylate kinase|nr:UMP kinase [Erysipelotrichaceae bacterium]